MRTHHEVPPGAQPVRRPPCSTALAAGAWMLAALGLAIHLTPAWALKDDEKQPMRIEADEALV